MRSWVPTDPANGLAFGRQGGQRPMDGCLRAILNLGSPY